MPASLLIYRLLLPIYVLVALPGWLLKMSRRGGWGSGLMERASLYREVLEFEPAGRVHVHAVSVGEAMLAMKLIKAWRARDREVEFVLAVATATGHAVASEANLEGVRVVYQPVDFRFMVRRYLDRFEPSQIVLVEGEMWPNLMLECAHRGIPVSLVNARMSPRSRRRYERFADWVRPVFSKLDLVAVQDPEDASTWVKLGVSEARVKVTGSLKFDPGVGSEPQRRDEFDRILTRMSGGRPVVLAASTHGGEELLVGQAVREAGGFYLCVPRHAERRAEVKAALEADGFTVRLRSEGEASGDCLVVDTTGELRDWTAHSVVVVIGKSFLGVGGQNPAEAIQAGRPVVFGPHMENFEPLASRLIEMGGARRVDGDLAATLEELLKDEALRRSMALRASDLLAGHHGATGRMISLLAENLPS